MKNIKKENFQNLPLTDLENKLKESKSKLVDLKFDLAAGKVKNIKEIKRIKKQIARILTAINLQKKNLNLK